MKKLCRFIVVLGGLVLAAHTHAQLYLGGVYGISDNDAPDASEVTGERGLDGDAGFRAYIGNQLSEKFAVELTYTDLGDYDGGEFVFEGETIEDISMITGYGASFVGKLPVSQKFSVFARLGVFVSEEERPTVEQRIVDGVQQLTLVLNNTESDVGVSGGLGVEYRYSRFFGLTLEANSYSTRDLVSYLYGAGVFFSF